MVEPALVHCRLCGEQADARFTSTFLGKYAVQYFLCRGCDSLQTESPYWLAEAYAGGNLSSLDTGAAQRNLDNLGVSWMLARTLRMSDILDWGGGDGLLCRLLRDHGLNCYVRDEYASASYAKAFTNPTFERPELILLFEVLEHFPEPGTALREIFGLGPDAILATTELYRGQGAPWWYLVPESGQHVFFYSEKALGQLANSYGYELLMGRGSYVMFVRKSVLTPTTRFMVRQLLRPRSVSVARCITGFLPTSGVQKDFDSVRNRELLR